MIDNFDIGKQFENQEVVSESFELTREELKDLENELVSLKKDFAEANARLKSAVEEGDIRENAAFDSADQEVKVLTRKISELESKIKNVTIREVTLTEDIALGSVVNLKIYEGEAIVDNMTITIVSKDVTGYELNEGRTIKDSDKFKSVKVAIDTPVAKSMIGRTEGSFEMLGVNGINRKYEFKMMR